MAFGFKKKEHYNYKMLEKVKIDIEKTNKRFARKSVNNSEPREYCQIVCESDEYRFYSYQTYSDGSGGYLLRQSKSQPSDIVYFGKCCFINRVFHNYLLQLNKNYGIGYLKVIAKNVKTSETKEFKFLSRKAYDFAKNGYHKLALHDEVNGVFIKDGKFIVKLTRKVDNAFSNNKKDTIVSDNTFYLVATYKNNQLNIEDIYPSDKSKNTSDTETRFRRNEEKHIKCNFKGNEQKCSNRCAECAIHLKDLADEAFKQNNWEEALTLYKKAAFIEPEFADAWFGFGKTLDVMDDHINALVAFDKAIEIDKLYDEAYFNKAIALQKLGRLDEATIIVNDLLTAGNNPSVSALKEKLINLGTKDIYKLDTAIKIITNKAIEIASQNNLLDKDGKLRTVKAIDRKTEFTAKVIEYCKNKYLSLGEEKFRSECITTSFYASICATLFYYKDRNCFADIQPFEYLKDHIDLERADAEAEHMLGVKSGDTESESLWNIIYAFARFSSNIISKVNIKDSETVIINAAGSAYLLGMLYAMYYNGRQMYNDRKKIDAALEKLAKSTKSYYYNPPVRSAMCYSIELPTQVYYDFQCDKCGLKKRITVDEAGGKEQNTMELYKQVAKQFDTLGFACEVMCYCDDCANKYFPSNSNYHINNIIFSIKLPWSGETVFSFPRRWGYVDIEYKMALAFLQGADTIEKLSAATDTNFEPQMYLDDIKAVLGENYEK